MKRNRYRYPLAALALGTSTAAIAQAAGPGARIIAVTNVVEIPQVNSARTPRSSTVRRFRTQISGTGARGLRSPPTSANTVKFPDESVS